MAAMYIAWLREAQLPLPLLSAFYSGESSVPCLQPHFVHHDVHLHYLGDRVLPRGDADLSWACVSVLDQYRPVEVLLQHEALSVRFGLVGCWNGSHHYPTTGSISKPPGKRVSI